ncbi:hypothetical protein RchiOBHm_Chr1g0342981 [Rosa chinensis]|uniref:Uncharacterized protein n=1 Tax=Rosa chinensis TaxID=74649 RepID=A0A2P6SE48_ROSCH|nr:hypothetical protein RchiOBHm_Chr1g0342981 [Rosa chinensis]
MSFFDFGHVKPLSSINPLFWDVILTDLHVSICQSCLSKIRSLVFVEIASFWNSELILDIPPPPSFVAITVVGVEPRTGTISFEENMITSIFRCL